MTDASPPAGSSPDLTEVLTVNTQIEAHCTRLTLTGEIDASTAHLLAEAAAEARDDLIVDLGAVSFLDSSGLRVLVSIRNQAADADRHLTLANVSPHVMKILEATNLTEAFDISPA